MAAVTRDIVFRALDWAWERAARGLPGQESAEALAGRHMDPSVPLRKRLAALIKRHKRQAAATGFLSGVGGLALLPVSVPASLAGTLFVQVRLVQAMALVCGHDLADARVRTLCGLCLCGSKATEAAAAAGAHVGGKLTERLLVRLGEETIRRINEQVGFRLLARFGETGLLGASRLAPVIGGLAGAAAGVAATAGIGKAALALLAGTGDEETRQSS
jgi:hypothetical protein